MKTRQNTEKQSKIKAVSRQYLTSKDQRRNIKQNHDQSAEPYLNILFYFLFFWDSFFCLSPAVFVPPLLCFPQKSRSHHGNLLFCTSIMAAPKAPVIHVSVILRRLTGFRIKSQRNVKIKQEVVLTCRFKIKLIITLQNKSLALLKLIVTQRNS